MQGKKLHGWGYSWALQEQWEPQLEMVRGCSMAQKQWGHTCQLGQGTTVQFWNIIPLLVGSCSAEAAEEQELLFWWGVCAGWSCPTCQAQPIPPGPAGLSSMQSLELPLTAAHAGQAGRCVPQSTGGQLRTRVSQRKWKNSNQQMINGTDMNPADSAEPGHLCWDRLTLSPGTWELKEEKLPTGKCLNP